jgi:hypothetical protein
LNARPTLPGTRAAGQLRRDFFGQYVRARTLDGPDKIVGDAYAIFEAEILTHLQEQLSEAALQTIVTFTDHLTDQQLAVCIAGKNRDREIRVNVRFRADPEELAHTLVEEFVHAQQILDGVDIVSQQLLAYQERPYEQEAKRIATEIVGYDPQNLYMAVILRHEPDTLSDPNIA